MNGVKVQCTVKEEHVETNKANIQRGMADLREINSPDITYRVYLLDFGSRSFVHLVLRIDDEAQKTVSALPSFQEFQRQLKESGPEVPPKAENLTLVGSSRDIF